MSKVFVLDTNKQPLNPVHPGQARLLLKEGKAAVFKRYPFTLILKVAVESPTLEPLRLKIDPGAKTTGMAVVNDATGEVVFAAEITHRGQHIKERMDTRRAKRRSRRQRKTRYRQPRFQNRRKREGTLPPSLESRVCNVFTWVRRVIRLASITALSQEVVKFDTQAMQTPGIEGIQYQQGERAGYEVRELLLERWNRQCVYCDRASLPLQVEHIQSRARGGTDRLSNLTLACEACNQAKGVQDIRVFLQDQPERLTRILAHAREPLKDAAALNATRWSLYERLQTTGLPVETGSGGLTKYNRSLRQLPKTHWLDAATVGMSTPQVLHVEQVHPLIIVATGHGCRQMCRMDGFGFPRTSAKQARRVQGFTTGDVVRAVVKRGKKRGTYVGRVAIRSSGYFNITTKTGTIQGISYRSCHPIHRGDGYTYSIQEGEGGIPPTPEGAGILSPDS
ncbi:MAG TPA: RNA-guided endonuclease IscB [Ktedonobacteraceae bacterium]